METHPGWRRRLLGLLVVLSMIGLAGCTGRRPPVGVSDTPERRVADGMRFLAGGHLDAAQEEFDKALRLDSRCGPAHTGNGLVFGTQADRSRDARERARLARQAFESLRKGKKYATGDEQKVDAYVAYIRVHTMTKEKGWLADAEENFTYAIAIDRRAPAPYFFMGEAYKQAYRFSEAARMYRKVLDINGEFTAEADQHWELMQRIQRAAPGTTTGKQIALAATVTRGEAAALLMRELRLDEVYATFGSRGSGPPSKPSTSGQQTEATARPPAATDMSGYPWGQDVDAVVRLGVRGLELYPDRTFRPGELVTRAAFALMMEDILIRAKGDEELASRFSGTPSPFVDLPSDRPYFRAVMVCTNLNIMKPVDPRGYEFRPMESVSGVEALLAIRSLKEYLRTG